MEYQQCRVLRGLVGSACNACRFLSFSYRSSGSHFAGAAAHRHLLLVRDSPAWQALVVMELGVAVRAI